MVGEVRHAAGDPALPAARRRQARPAQGHPLLDTRSSRRRGTTALAGGPSRRITATTITCPPRRDGDRAACRCRRSSTSRAPTASPARSYFTSRWPHEGVDFTGKRVGVIGTGSSGIQSIPEIAKQAAELVVFQRTPNFSMPAHNGPASAERLAQIAEDRDAYREAARWTLAGVTMHIPLETVAMLSEEERRARFDAAWDEGELLSLGSRFTDLITNRDRQRHHRRAVPRAHPLDRQGPGHRRGAVPDRPRHRHQADVPRQRLLRDVQPAPRAPRRPAQAADHHGHREGDRHDRRVVRVRRHRLRHRLRRHDRCHRRRRHHRPRRRDAEAEVGRRPGHLPRR